MTSSAQLEAHLREQVELLDHYCDAYDEGKIVAAKPMAVALRVLFHDTKSSHSVLGPHGLGLLDGLGLPDAATSFNPPPMEDRFGVPAAGKQHPSLAVVGMFTDGKNGWFPAYETVPVATAPMVSFLAWWKDVKSTDRYGWRMTRRGIVLAMSNKDGGAHVDLDQPDETYMAAVEGSFNTPVETASGVTITIGESSEPPTGVVVRAMVRHVVEEACFAIRAAAAEVLGDLAEPPEPVVQPVRPFAFMPMMEWG